MVYFCAYTLKYIKNAWELGLGHWQYYVSINALRSKIQLTNVNFIISLHLSDALKSEAI